MPDRRYEKKRKKIRAYLTLMEMSQMELADMIDDVTYKYLNNVLIGADVSKPVLDKAWEAVKNHPDAKDIYL